MRFTVSRISILVAILMAGPSLLSGQSLLNSGGLGMVAGANDARAVALGGITLGATTPAVVAGQPTAALDLLAGTVTFTAQPSWGEYTLNDSSGEFQGTRFPLLGFSFPAGLRSVFTLTAGSAFDQRWSLVGTGTAEIGDQLIETLDKFDSDGGISLLQAGFARRISAELSVGGTLGLYRGQVTRTFTRQFDTVAVANPIAPFINGGKWSFFGPEITAEAMWDPISLVRIGASVTYPGTLKAEPGADTEGAAREVQLPMQLGVGVTLVLSPTLVFTGGLDTAAWSNLGDPVLDGLARGRTIDLGGGLEWSGKSFWAGSFPLRLGYRHTELPFLFGGSEAVETSFSGGFRLIMTQTQGIPLTTLDVTWESGKRTAGALDESFRRMSITFRVSGR